VHVSLDLGGPGRSPRPNSRPMAETG
jgi:hypothetical protein